MFDKHAIGLLVLLGLLIVSLLPGCASQPDNTLCHEEKRVGPVSYCAHSSSRKTGTTTNRVCDSRNVCNSTYSDVYETQCDSYATRMEERSVCSWYCRPGFSALPGLDANGGCYAGEELTRRSAQRNAKLALEEEQNKKAQDAAKRTEQERQLAQANAEKELQRHEAPQETARRHASEAARVEQARVDILDVDRGRILSNCLGVEAFHRNRLLQPWHVDSLLHAAAGDGANFASRQLKTWVEFKQLLLTDKYYPHACWVVGKGPLPAPEHVSYLLLASDAGNGADILVAYYYELWPRGTGFIPAGWAGRESWLNYGQRGQARDEVKEACRAIASHTDPPEFPKSQRYDARFPKVQAFHQLKDKLDFEQSGLCVTYFPALWSDMEKTQRAVREAEFDTVKRTFEAERLHH